VRYTLIPFAGEVIAASRAAAFAYTGSLKEFVRTMLPVRVISQAIVPHDDLSSSWSCIITSSQDVQATQVSPVPHVAGSAVRERLRTQPVMVEPDTQEKDISSSCFAKYKRILHDVTVGTVARVIVVSAGLIFSAVVVRNKL
jgi:hypothetical protein